MVCGLWMFAVIYPFHGKQNTLITGLQQKPNGKTMVILPMPQFFIREKDRKRT